MLKYTSNSCLFKLGFPRNSERTEALQTPNFAIAYADDENGL